MNILKLFTLISDLDFKLQNWEADGSSLENAIFVDKFGTEFYIHKVRSEGRLFFIIAGGCIFREVDTETETNKLMMDLQKGIYEPEEDECF